MVGGLTFTEADVAQSSWTGNRGKVQNVYDLYARAREGNRSHWWRRHAHVIDSLLSHDGYKIKTISCAHDKETVEKVRPRRLISTRSIKLVDFGDNIPIPDYAILSHTWGPGEVTFRELNLCQDEGNVDTSTLAKPGHRKIRYACREARRQNLDYLWVDTCCINQEDKGDVHRNIRSMYAFYQNSSICYAYLSDRDRYNLSEFLILTSRWFSRGLDASGTIGSS
ncbi:hypothetical protein K435DRAFT_973967 [Dendrothele bispora CBS 962.96]|uniref:Heterokaryon incompatibility domain-containing protein n=1 Tax=Dendrothele bispora (strain CBS 962.96) TaxID=1314807 RepID=A0A4S8KP62_DENBC|nr:hypothetical protein K435DRAFT_973967 [Dendrothele bispora CBS 962.96]